MRAKKTRLTAALGALLLLALAGSVAASPVVIAHPDLGADRVDAATLKNVFLGKATSIDGVDVHFATLADGPVHDAFLEAYVGKSPSSFLAHWRKLTFTGKGALPKRFDTEEAMVRYVADTPGAIGYVDGGSPHGGVKVLTVD